MVGLAYYGRPPNWNWDMSRSKVQVLARSLNEKSSYQENLDPTSTSRLFFHHQHAPRVTLIRWEEHSGKIFIALGTEVIITVGNIIIMELTQYGYYHHEGNYGCHHLHPFSSSAVWLLWVEANQVTFPDILVHTFFMFYIWSPLPWSFEGKK